MHPENDTIAKSQEGIEIEWRLTNDLDWVGTDVEAWDNEKKDGKPVSDKWNAWYDKIAKEDKNVCWASFTYNGYKDADAGTTRRDLRGFGAC